jgi:hypothetical protein
VEIKCPEQGATLLRGVFQRPANGRAFMYQSNLSDQELFDLSKQSWFKERVFDIFLWEVGGDSLPRA